MGPFESQADYAAVLLETEQHVDLYGALLKKGSFPDPYPSTRACARVLQKSKSFTTLLDPGRKRERERDRERERVCV